MTLISRITRLSLLLFIAALAGACASTQTQQAAPEAAPEVEEQAAVEIEPWEGDPMDIPLDGSSMEAFDASLARVKAYATPEQYDGLLMAIDYLLTYDIGAGKDYEKLVSRLDGQTPAEIWARVKWRTPAPGRSPVEKDAADAKIIDG
jgi:hypothetical protein